MEEKRYWLTEKGYDYVEDVMPTLSESAFNLKSGRDKLLGAIQDLEEARSIAFEKAGEIRSWDEMVHGFTFDEIAEEMQWTVMFVDAALCQAIMDDMVEEIHSGTDSNKIGEGVAMSDNVSTTEDSKS